LKIKAMKNQFLFYVQIIYKKKKIGETRTHL